MALAETLDVLPILSLRGRVGRGMFSFVMAIALGKMAGSLMYFLMEGFYETSAF
jgi:stage V sporulation protein AB